MKAYPRKRMRRMRDLSNADISMDNYSGRDVSGRGEEAGGAVGEGVTRSVGERAAEGQKGRAVLILDYPSVMAQLSPLHLRELPKYFEVVLVGRTGDLKQADLDALGVSAVGFYYEFPDAGVREKFRAVIREIVKVFSNAEAYYFSSLHWWAMEEASKTAVLLIPPASVRSIATAIAMQNEDLVKRILHQFTIKIVK